MTTFTKGEDSLPKEVEPQKASILWLFYHVSEWMKKLVRRNPVKGGIILLAMVIILWIAKPVIQPFALWFRVHLFEELVILLTAFLTWFFFRHRKGWAAIVTSIILLTLCVLTLTVGKGVRDYHRLYRQYLMIDKKELSAEPLTDFDRVQPRHSIHTSANKCISDVKQTTVPNFVRWRDGKFVWSLGIEPEYPIQKLFGKVERIFVLPGQDSNLDFSEKHQEEVSFESGENMYFLKNLHYLARQGFGPWKFFNYEPSNVKYVPGPDGKVVQIVTLIKWEGIFFPRPVFGGVIVVRQSDSAWGALVRHSFLGEHEWVRPDEISRNSWLSKQDIVPFVVSRNIAQSFRFRYGYTDPLPLVHKKDIRIPDMPGDRNEQPFTTYFSFGGGDSRNKLYHYFALEPYISGKQNVNRGLNTSVLVPADGIGSIYYFGHDDRKQNLIGVSAVATYIKDANKMYDWDRADVAEHRPWIRDIFGKRRHFWLSTIVTRLDGASKIDGDFIAGSAIEIYLTDSLSRYPIKVTANKPELWVSEVESALKKNEQTISVSH